MSAENLSSTIPVTADVVEIPQGVKLSIELVFKTSYTKKKEQTCADIFNGNMCKLGPK